MPKRMSIQKLDHIRRTDPERALNIVDQRAKRNMTSTDPLVRFKGQVTEDAVDAARARLRNQKP